MGFAEEEMAQLHGQSGGSDTYYTAAVRESSVVTATLGDGTVLRRLTRAEQAARDELQRARDKFPVGFRSAHEGFAVLKEEVDELWAEIKANDRDDDRIRAEAVQVAAMALRFLEDVCGLRP